MFAPVEVSEAGPPDVPASYRGGSARLLTWEFVERRLKESTYYWLASVSPGGRPHVVPLWGVYVEGRVCVDGHPEARWMRNLERNRRAVVHVPDPEHVVIVSGLAERLEDGALSDASWLSVDALYQAKYSVTEGSPWLVIHPRKVVAWDGVDLATMTRWSVGARSISGALD